ncbi:Aldose 1-epimerase precursor [Sedimentisphaera cyanobacteriorum]|uniref:Aldose 1-epimerase n=1 Tax=Sedimentisphaera cyanobacteriorum TaxID=1940790 RepID=A0A1Q2HRM2_9BACT|nr:aldose epimerase family protein [Sedimentisphaera cyanobacteriorum]AQQ09896.1 Aldose 1-epimerase precursor [Sedimentisphaera cyanobacteriorum]
MLLRKLSILTLVLSVAVLSSCTETQKKDSPKKCPKQSLKPSIEKSYFGTTKDGQKVYEYMLDNGKGMDAGIITYGGVMTYLNVPDKNGKSDDILLGFDNLKDFEEKSDYFNALIGRYGNRIAKGKFELNGKTYTLATNNGENHLHGGDKGFDKRVWSATHSVTEDAANLTLTYLSKDGEEGYPGSLRCVVTYSITADNELVIDYKAETDKATPVNLTQHNYYNLDGQGSGKILDHKLMINASEITPVDEGLIPTGEIVDVYGPFDFTEPKKIGKHINSADIQMKYGKGYDHNFVLDKGKGMGLAAKVYEPDSGRIMEVWTEEPGLQFYSGNFLDGTIVGKEGKRYVQRCAFCLETQHFPDSPNKPQFPSTILEPGEVYNTKTIYKFKTK